MKKAAIYNLEICARAALQAKRNRRLRRNFHGTTEIFLCLVDHFEPSVGQASREVARERMKQWRTVYPQIAARHRDADGRPPAHGFFYPWDEFDAWELEQIGEICRLGYGELDLHLHHKDDTAETVRQKFREAVCTYDAAGLLPHWKDGKPAWGFIHGNWALDNSRHEHGQNFCGVNNELEILRQEGCYADFTFPAWQHFAQPRQVNSLYYAADTPQPKSYDTGREIQAGKEASGDLMIVQGPLIPFLAPKPGGGKRLAVDDGDIAHYRRYAPARLDRWVDTALHVVGRPDRLFIKLHSHGAADENRAAMLDHDLDALFSDAEARYNDGTRFRLHYVSAREMFNVLKATEANADIPISEARDFLIRQT